jgi:hypothetical protein
MHAIVAGDRSEPQVGDDHPLRRKLYALVGGVRRAFPRPCGDDVDSGLKLADGLKQRKVGDDVLVKCGGDVHCPAPDFRSVLGGDLFRAGGIDGLQKIVTVDRRQQIAVADAIDVDGDLRGVDGDEGAPFCPWRGSTYARPAKCACGERSRT